VELFNTSPWIRETSRENMIKLLHGVSVHLGYPNFFSNTTDLEALEEASIEEWNWKVSAYSISISISIFKVKYYWCLNVLNHQRAQ